MSTQPLRLNSLRLRNFRNYPDFTIDFTEPRTLLLGENGVGKSTVIDAISWVLTGRCRGVDGRGGGQKDLIGDAGPDMSVTADLEGLGPVERTYANNGNTTCTVKDPVAKLGTTEPFLAAALYSRTFFQLGHSDAKQLLMRLLDVRVDPTLLPALKLKRAATLDELDAYYQQAFNDRGAAKKVLDALQVPEPPKVADIGATNIEQLEADLEKAQDEYQAAVITSSGLDAQVKQLNNQLKATNAATLGNRDQTAGNLQTHKAMLDKHTVEVGEARAELTRAEDLPAEPVRELQTQVADLNVLVKRLESHDPEHGCILSSSIPCMTAAKDFSGHISKIGKDVKALEKRIKAGEDRAQKIGAATGKLKAAEQNVLYHTGQITQIEAQLKAHDEAGPERADIQQRQIAMDAAVKDANDTANALRLDVQTKQGKIRAASEYSQTMKARDKALEKLAEQQKTLDALEEKVKQLGPKGVRMKALTDAVADFEGAINGGLQRFGFKLRIQADPWAVQMKKADGPWRPYELLSDGEKLWTGLAFQLALALQSGLDFCCIDAAETVVGVRRQLLTELIMLAPVGQILVAMAKGAAEADPVIDGLQVVRIAVQVPTAA